MPAQPQKVYPVRGRYVLGVPHTTHVVETKAEAEELIASGAFTDNPRHPDRLDDEPPAEAVASDDKE